MPGSRCWPIDSLSRSVADLAVSSTVDSGSANPAKQLPPNVALGGRIQSGRWRIPASDGGVMSEIDWATELKKIEREYDGLPPEPTPAELTRRRAAERREQERVRDSALRIGAWGRAALVVALATAINFWPYFRGCGVGLFAYVGAEMMVVCSGLWLV